MDDTEILMTMDCPEYDFAVIGAGSAGCVVAGRLGAAGYSVLLLEAGGPDRSPWIHIPLGYSRLYANPKVNWCYSSCPEPHLDNRRLFQPRGKVLGGTGSINGMIYMRGQPEDFDSWAETGCVGWGWEDVLPYFRKSEDQERGSDEFHGVGGPVAVSDLRTTHVLGEAFHSASEQLGVPRNQDFNGAVQEGTGYVQTTTRNGRRWSTAKGYLTGQARKNIDLRLGAVVDKIVLVDGHAVGVDWEESGQPRTCAVRSEVILCAGAFNSPQLLQLSGVGDGSLLRKFGIRPYHHLPAVGENLQDHFGVGAQYRSTVSTTVNDLYNNRLKGGWQLLRYLIFRTGPFADNGNYSNTFIRSGPEISRPDMMVTFMAWCTNEELEPLPFSAFTILAEHMRPLSRGSVRINGRFSTDQPAIRFNFLSDEEDRRAAVAGLKFARKIAATEPMASCVESELAPGREVSTDDELFDYCRSSGLSLLHAAGSCRMGTGADSVVDSRLRVHGLKGLRVIDASIMPRIVTGNTNAASIMIGEKGVAMVIKDTKEAV